MQPPRLASWLLEHAAPGNDALIGDLLEEYQRRGSPAWYWRQVLTAVALHASRAALLVVAIAALFLIGSRVSVPGAHADALTLLAGRAVGTPFGAFSVLTGGQLGGVTIFALGILPYVSAALIVQMVAFVWNFMTRHSPTPRRFPVVAVAWCVAIPLCAIQALGLALFLERVSAFNGGLNIVLDPGLGFGTTTILTLTGGTIALMLLSDYISRRQIGNGMFLVFLAGVVSGVAGVIVPLLRGEIDPFAVLTYSVLHLALVAIVSSGYRRSLVRAVE